MSDSFVVQVADINEQPTAGYYVGAFPDEQTARAWQPPPGVMVTGVFQVRDWRSTEKEVSRRAAELLEGVELNRAPSGGPSWR